MAIKCSFFVEGIRVVAEVSRGKGESGAKWATVAHNHLNYACALGGLLCSPLLSFSAGWSRDVSIYWSGGQGWVTVSMTDLTGASQFSKSWRVDSSSNMRDVIDMVRAFALSRVAIVEQMTLPW